MRFDQKDRAVVNVRGIVGSSSVIPLATSHPDVVMMHPEEWLSGEE